MLILILIYSYIAINKGLKFVKNIPKQNAKTYINKAIIIAQPSP